MRQGYWQIWKAQVIMITGELTHENEQGIRKKK